METLCLCIYVVRVYIMHTYSKMPTRWQTHISNVNDYRAAPSGHFNNSSQILIRPKYYIQFNKYTGYSLTSIQVNFVVMVLQVLSRDRGCIYSSTVSKIYSRSFSQNRVLMQVN